MNLEFIKGSFHATIKIVGREYSALVDTGAESSMLVLKECLDMGLVAEGGRSITCLHGDKKELPMFSGEVELAGRTAKLNIVGMPRAISIPGSLVVAVAGKDILGGGSLALDFAGGRGQVS